MVFVVFLGLYVFLFFYALFFKAVSPWELFDPTREYFRNFNLIPFHTIDNYLSSTQVSWIIVASNVIGNVVIFIPLAIYLQLIKKTRKLWISLLLVFLATVIVEALQFAFALGAFDIDDIILNCLGGIVGIVIYRLLRLMLKTDERIWTALLVLGFAAVLAPVALTIIWGMGGIRIRIL